MSIKITDRDGKEHEVASAGVGAGGLTTGIIGTSLSALALLREGGLGGIFGGFGGRGREHGEGECRDTRIIAEKDATISFLLGKDFTLEKTACLEKEICQLKCREAVLEEKVRDLHEDYREGDKELKLWVEGHFARTRQVIPADEIVECRRPEVVKVIEKIIVKEKDHEREDHDEGEGEGRKHKR